MKLSLFLAFCFISTMHYSVEGGLVKDFFGRVKETAQVVHKDIHDIWRPDNGSTDKNNVDQVTSTPETPDTAQSNNDKKEDQKDDIHKIDDKNEESKLSEITTPASTTVAQEKETIEDKHQETTTVEPSTTTEKERANFAGACQTNYKRTADGRCKPVAA